MKCVYDRFHWAGVPGVRYPVLAEEVDVVPGGPGVRGMKAAVAPEGWLTTLDVARVLGIPRGSVHGRLQRAGVVCRVVVRPGVGNRKVCFWKADGVMRLKDSTK